MRRGDDLEFGELVEEALDQPDQLDLHLGVEGLVEVVEEEDVRRVGAVEDGEQGEGDEGALAGEVRGDAGAAAEVEVDLAADDLQAHSPG